jgi:vacuolar-type H+-ATPase subunit I/STV1
MALEFIVNENFQLGNASAKKAGLILEVSESIVDEEMKKGYHADSKKPISGLLNHCSPYNDAAKNKLKSFNVKPYVEPDENAEEEEKKANEVKKKEEIETLRKEFDKLGAAYDPNWQGKRLAKELEKAKREKGETVPAKEPKREKIN